MKGPYLESHEMKKFNDTLKDHVLSSTFNCWVATRLRGGSASLHSEGNVSIELLRAFDRIADAVEDAIKNPKPTKYEAGMIRIKVEPEPKGQKYPIGTRVRISKDLGESMRHFASDVNATVQYTYAHAFGGSDVKSYCLDVDGKGSSAWYKEWQLTALDS